MFQVSGKCRTEVGGRAGLVRCAGHPGKKSGSRAVQWVLRDVVRETRGGAKAIWAR